jgi:Arc/MetJ family transcription regulator
VATNLDLDDKLIVKAVRLGKHKSKREAVTQALVEYVSHLEQRNIESLFGAVPFDPAYDYKKQRSRR